jgi:hypothetical protein
MAMDQLLTRTIAIAAILATTSACGGGAIKKPLSTSPIASGINTVESVRKELEGTWTLVSLVVQDASGKRATPEATGTLVWDAFGNLKIEYRLSESGIKALEAIGVKPQTPVIVTDGRAVINPQDKAIQYVPPDASKRAFDPKLAEARANPFALERLRYYVIGTDGTLTLSTRHDNGQDAAVSRWKKNAG